ncbi:hypothetical protein P3339_11770 [Microbulbifer sp. MLAF003]|uniref:hypothetical protein n=1 Tax=unclassified Microbulbifer TaxID=2619833 RepID=UPI0024ACE87A|nr:hypothetical protein [Microbulbifer sp. MLAF003]WHI53391.1 hypothetical protein P3339_11770 [Microbulbifer sp. MLAF003]
MNNDVLVVDARYHLIFPQTTATSRALMMIAANSGLLEAVVMVLSNAALPFWVELLAAR